MPPSVFTRGDSTRPARQEAPVAAASLEKRAGRHLAGLGRADGSLMAIGLTSCDPIDAGLSSMASPTWSPSMASDARRCKPESSPAMNMTLSASANDWLHPDKLTRLCTVPIIGVLESDWDLGSFAMDSRRRAIRRYIDPQLSNRFGPQRLRRRPPSIVIRRGFRSGPRFRSTG